MIMSSRVYISTLPNGVRRTSSGAARDLDWSRAMGRAPVHGQQPKTPVQRRDASMTAPHASGLEAVGSASARSVDRVHQAEPGESGEVAGARGPGPPPPGGGGPPEGGPAP